MEQDIVHGADAGLEGGLKDTVYYRDWHLRRFFDEKVVGYPYARASF